MSIHAEHITFTYPGAPAPALDNISVKLEPGKVYGLLGANGSGKSTFLKVLSGFLKPESGTVTLDNIAITGFSAEQRAQHLSFHPQDPDAPGFLTVYEITEMACYYGSALLEDVERAIDALNLNGLRFSSMGSISGGERQRAFLARTLAQGAPVTLWDEPMLNLDPAHQMLFGNLLRNISNSGSCVLASFHDLTLAANLCDELICLRQGHIPLMGSVAEIMTPVNLFETFGVHFATQHTDQGWFSRVLNPDR